ncbi:MAG: RNA polymerase sigma factor [Sphingomonadales bacterium]|nr:RNA polymerase sigma factor [Sphingomonadales bacterium]
MLIEDLYRDYFKDLCKNIHKSFGGGPPEPEEVVQAAFAKFAGLDNPERIAEPRSFLFITARNLLFDCWRRDSKANAYIAEQIALDADLKLEGITPERVVLAKDYFERLVAAIKSLPRKQQIVLGMNRLEGKSYRQIREETGWSSGDISRNMSAGMDKLMRIMEGSDDGLEGGK